MTQAKRSNVEHTSGQGTDLWLLITPLIIWAVHFLVCYVGAAVYCAKEGRAATLLPVEWLVLAATLCALTAIGLVAWTLWRVRARSVTDDDLSFEANTAEERHRFLSHVGLMLCVLSAAGVIYVTLPVLVLETCR